MDRWRNRQIGELVGHRPTAVVVAEKALVDQHGEQLFREQRIALRRHGDPLQEVRRECRPAEEILINCEVSSALSGSRRIEVAFSLPPPHPGRASSSSGRAMHSTTIGASRERSLTCSIRSRNVGSAQWRSSNTTTSGRRRETLRRASGSPRRSSRSSRPSSHRVRAPGDTGHDQVRFRLTFELDGDHRCGRFRRAIQAGDVGDDLGQRPVRDALAVGQAVSSHHSCLVVEPSDELADESGLPDARSTEHGDQMRARSLTVAANWAMRVSS